MPTRVSYPPLPGRREGGRGEQGRTRFHGLDRHNTRSSPLGVFNRAGEEVKLLTGADSRGLPRDAGPALGPRWCWKPAAERSGGGGPHRGAGGRLLQSWTRTSSRSSRSRGGSRPIAAIAAQHGPGAVGDAGQRGVRAAHRVQEPQAVIGELRKLFSASSLVARQITMQKNAIQAAVLVEDGIVLSETQKSALFRATDAESILAEGEGAAAAHGAGGLAAERAGLPGRHRGCASPR